MFVMTTSFLNHDLRAALTKLNDAQKATEARLKDLDTADPSLGTLAQVAINKAVHQSRAELLEQLKPIHEALQELIKLAEEEED